MFAVPNGGTRRDAIEGANLKKQGVKAGVPDIFLPAPRPPYHGLFLELKARNGKVQDNQREWLDALSRRGYKAVVAYGFEAARNEIERYLNLKGE